jgi:hypothetical protein
MDRSAYIQHIKNKLDLWGRDLSVLEDDIERSDEDVKEEYQTIMSELMRNYEWIESYLDELELMMEESFEEEKVVLNDRVEDFEAQLKDARDKVKDI